MSTGTVARPTKIYTQLIELRDVDASGRSNGDTLVWDEALQLYVHRPVDGSGIPVSLGDLSNVDPNVDALGPSEDGHVLLWNDASGNFQVRGLTLGALTNVDGTVDGMGPGQDGFFLNWDNTLGQWDSIAPVFVDVFNSGTLRFGNNNEITTNENCTVGGGSSNTVGSGSSNSTIAGGFNNSLTGNNSIIMGGLSNTVSSDMGIGLGSLTTVSHPYSMVVGLGSNPTNSQGNNTVTFDASGGVYLLNTPAGSSNTELISISGTGRLETMPLASVLNVNYGVVSVRSETAVIAIPGNTTWVELGSTMAYTSTAIGDFGLDVQTYRLVWNGANTTLQYSLGASCFSPDQNNRIFEFTILRNGVPEDIRMVNYTNNDRGRPESQSCDVGIIDLVTGDVLSVAVQLNDTDTPSPTSIVVERMILLFRSLT